MTLRNLTLFLVLSLGLTLSACGGSDTEENTDTGTDTTTDTGTDTMVDTTPDVTPDTTPDTPINCDYPMNDGFVLPGKIMPPLAWTNAHRGDGSTFEFTLEDFFCDDATYGQYNVVMFIVTAEWCPSCHTMLDDAEADGRFAAVEAAGGLVVFLEFETTAYAPSSGADAFATITDHMESPPGIIVGDGETIPNSQPTPIINSPLITGYPGGFVVRRSDMRVISKTTENNVYIDLTGIAADPDAFYTGPPDPTTPNCGAAEEEASEPLNNTAAGATLLTPDTLYTGGICDDEPDFYEVDVSGEWLLELTITLENAPDLDFYLWDVENDTYLLDDRGRRIGSAETAATQPFQACGPAIVRVFGYNGATAPYRLALSELGPGQCQ